MKKLYVSFMALTLILSSCGGPLSITKRHYNSGFYVERSAGSKQEAPSVATMKSEKLVSPKPELTLVTPTAASRPDKKDSPVNTTVTASAESKHARNAKYTATRQTPVSKPVTPHATMDKEKSKSNIFVHTNTNTSSDDRTILLVVLCILLPPVAVYLKENALGLNFWIDLLLTLLFWVPGIIFAFIVCFLM